MKAQIIAGALLLCVVTGCSETEELMAVRNYDSYAKGGWPTRDQQLKVTGYQSDDRPRVVTYRDDVKQSFRDFVAATCNVSGRKGRPASATVSVWQSANANSNYCVSRIASYAVDQCDWMTLNQNNAATTVNLTTGAALVGAGLVTDGFALAHPNSGEKTSSTALSAVVLSSASNYKNLIPMAAPVAPTSMIAAAPQLAEAAGVVDPNDTASGWDEDRMRALAHVHDQLLSMCGANAIGFRKPGKR